MGTNDLMGLEFLKKHELENCGCDLEKNFAFISYAHDEIDTRIVRSVFKKLYDKGWNLWIDTANIPRDQNAWSKAAKKALVHYKTCKIALFFRSEESLIREPIRKELELIDNAEHINRTVTIDIFQKYKSATEYKVYLQNADAVKFDICDEICDIVDTENSAIRLNKDAENDINILVDEIIRELEEEDVYCRERKTASVKEVAKKAPDAIVTEQVPVEKTDRHVVGSSAELRNLLASDECKDVNLKKLLKENRVQVRISSSDISFREEYTKYDTWLFSFDKSEPDADKWDFYLLRKGNMDAADRTCFDATDLSVSVSIKVSFEILPIFGS